MSILEKILKNNNPKPDPIQEKVEYIQSILDQSDIERIARKKAIESALKLIEEHPNIPPETFIPELQQNSSLSDTDIATIIQHLKSEKDILATVHSTSLPSEVLATIANEANISTDTAEKIVNEIEDEDIQKEQQRLIAEERERQILEQLSDIYSNCENIEYPKVESAITSLRKTRSQDFTPAINKKIMSIAAKRAALDCMAFGNARIFSLTKMVSSLDMFESDFPTMAHNEYKKLKADFDDEGKKYKEFTSETQKTLHNALLEDIAKQSAENFDSVGDFALPETDKFKKLSSDDIKFFVKVVNTASKDITKSSSRRLVRLLHGENDSLLDKTIRDIEINIRKLPKEEQLNAAKIILETLKQRNEAQLLIRQAKSNSSPVNLDNGVSR